jgi:hypothetical protein
MPLCDFMQLGWVVLRDSVLKTACYILILFKENENGVI